jgi:hypothetical protein
MMGVVDKATPAPRCGRCPCQPNWRRDYFFFFFFFLSPVSCLAGVFFLPIILLLGG